MDIEHMIHLAVATVASFEAGHAFPARAIESAADDVIWPRRWP